MKTVFGADFSVLRQTPPSIFSALIFWQSSDREELESSFGLLIDLVDRVIFAESKNDLSGFSDDEGGGSQEPEPERGNFQSPPAFCQHVILKET